MSKHSIGAYVWRAELGISNPPRSSTMRVQIPAYTDRWMMGDRYGEVVLAIRRTKEGVVSVKLDKSGKTIRVILDDCKMVEE